MKKWQELQQWSHNISETEILRVKEIEKPLPVVQAADSIEKVSSLINKDNNAVLMMDMGGNCNIITKYDVIAGMI